MNGGYIPQTWVLQPYGWFFWREGPKGLEGPKLNKRPHKLPKRFNNCVSGVYAMLNYGYRLVQGKVQVPLRRRQQVGRVDGGEAGIV